MSSEHDDWDDEERETLETLKGQIAAISRRHAGDPPLDLLMAARAGVLPDGIQKEMEAHLGRSAWSRALVDGVEQSSSELALDAVTERRLWTRISRPVPAEPAPVATASTAWWNYAAAAVAASLVIAVMGSRGGGAPTVDRPRDPVSIATAPVAEPAPLALAFTKPDVILSPAALTWRGGSATNPFLTDLQPAIEAYRNGAYADADARFTTLAVRYPSAIEVLYFHGIVRMLGDDFAGATRLLSAAVALNEPTFADDAAWYLAVAEQRSGHDADALRRMAGLCAGGGARASDACGAEKLLRARELSPRP